MVAAVVVVVAVVVAFKPAFASVEINSCWCCCNVIVEVVIGIVSAAIDIDDDDDGGGGVDVFINIDGVTVVGTFIIPVVPAPPFVVQLIVVGILIDVDCPVVTKRIC